MDFNFGRHHGRCCGEKITRCEKAPSGPADPRVPPLPAEPVFRGDLSLSRGGENERALGPAMPSPRPYFGFRTNLYHRGNGKFCFARRYACCGAEMLIGFPATRNPGRRPLRRPPGFPAPEFCNARLHRRIVPGQPCGHAGATDRASRSAREESPSESYKIPFAGSTHTQATGINSGLEMPPALDALGTRTNNSNSWHPSIARPPTSKVRFLLSAIALLCSSPHLLRFTNLTFHSPPSLSIQLTIPSFRTTDLRRGAYWL